ncbi:ATPase, T2SS/T4P/T4SS family [Pyrococcus abyssi]|uniref:Intein containing bacterial type II secretion system protein E n=1 Tax=Pyrococcus abyssi (strain GE5 / Orsay) TaxID=272844 RepID=Q9UYW7_PYRAB|nr:ATPase, T2SS/T4P/T4SS family [Pyrococcus abyssi]CAB50295.1 Intein containing bacterial type II secretion system protein E [Pyrococcus abyssi GE5]CCE70833.1 TPA: secretory protein kinase [Pyrococcus abyssi GE5]
MSEEKKKVRSWIDEILSGDNLTLEAILKKSESERKEEKKEETPLPKTESLSLASILAGVQKKEETEKETETLPFAVLEKTGGAPRLEDILKRSRPQERKEEGVGIQGILVPSSKYAGQVVRVLDVYGNVRIVRVKGEAVPIYEISVPELSREEEKLLKLVRDRAIVEIQIDPESIPNLEERRKVFLREVRKMVKEMAPTLSEGRVELLSELIVQNMIGYGKLDPLVRDDNLEEIMVIGIDRPVYVWHRRFGMCKTNIVFKTERELLTIIERIAREVGRRIDQQNPLLDARLPDGSRVNATLPPISLDGPTLTIRKFKKDPLTIIDLIKFRTLSSDVAAFLWLLVDGLGVKPANILVAGGTGSGKTTTLNSLAMFIPPSERVISIEDTAELQLPIEHWVRLETRPPNVEGKGEITMDDLVKNTLRMRPDRIIVGEVRGPEARTMFTAMNTGHDGALYYFSEIQLPNGKEFIGKLVDELFEKYHDKIGKYKDMEYVELNEEDTFEVISIGPDLSARRHKVTHVWRRKVKDGEKLVKIRTASGKELVLTQDHPVFVLLGRDVARRDAGNVKVGDEIAVLNTRPDFSVLSPPAMPELLSEPFNYELSSIGDVAWDEVVEVDEIDAKGLGVEYLYDLTVDINHNYVANGIVVSNCMGTIHSNSARETIIRLESPPMNVPKIMIPALDIIIMQVRYHTRKKGTIRRVTEIAEVSGIEGESIQLNFLYKYDPAKDELVRTEVPSRFLQILSYHTGMSLEEIHLEIEKRKLVLDWMIEKGLRRIDEVGAQIREFYIDEEEFFKKIQREAATMEISRRVKEFI